MIAAYREIARLRGYYPQQGGKDPHDVAALQSVEAITDAESRAAVAGDV